MKQSINIACTFTFLALITACSGGGGGEPGDTTGNTNTTSTPNTTETETTTSTSTTSTPTNGNIVVTGSTGFTLICDEPNGLVGCWVSPCIETDAINQIYAQQMVSFEADGTATISTTSHLGSSTCQSSNPIEIVGLFERTYTEGDTVLTDTGTTATELNSTQAIPGTITLTQRFSIYQIVADQLCVPDADFTWETGNHPGYTFGPTLPSLRGTDIDFSNCLTRFIP